MPGLFPTGGLHSPGVDPTSLEGVLDIAWHLTLPVLTLTLAYLADYALIMRGSLLDEIGEDYLPRPGPRLPIVETGGSPSPARTRDMLRKVLSACPHPRCRAPPGTAQGRKSTPGPLPHRLCCESNRAREILQADLHVPKNDWRSGAADLSAEREAADDPGDRLSQNRVSGGLKRRDIRNSYCAGSELRMAADQNAQRRSAQCVRSVRIRSKILVSWSSRPGIERGRELFPWALAGLFGLPESSIMPIRSIQSTELLMELSSIASSSNRFPQFTPRSPSHP